MCKPWKDERGHVYGESSEKPTVRRRLQDDPVQDAVEYLDEKHYPFMGPQDV